MAHGKAANYYKIASAVLPRHDHIEEIFLVLSRYKERGFTDIWIENDYLRWTWNKDANQGFGGNWRIFNIFDITMSKHKSLYQDYLSKLSDKCSEVGLDLYGSFWLPMLNAELRAYLAANTPQAIGSYMWHGQRLETLCTCHDGVGLPLIEDIVTKYMKLFPAIQGLKIATLDNNALICDESCPHSHGTTRARHVGNLYGSTQKAMQRAKTKADLIVYESFWESGYLEEVQKQLTQHYFLICKIEMKSEQTLDSSIPGESLFDASSVSDEEGDNFKEAIRSLGANRVIKMPALGSGIDDFFFGSPPMPGRLYRRMRLHRKLGCNKFIEFDCGGHWDDSDERSFAIFNASPDISEDVLLKLIAKEIYKREDAQKLAIAGWSAFDKGYGYLPVGLENMDCKAYSGRFGFAWTMCIATPLVREAFGDSDQLHRIHWFSPYNFFNSALVDRLETEFLRVQFHWQQASRLLTAASTLENDSPPSGHEAISAEGDLLGVASALNWCNARRYARTSARSRDFDDLALLEIDITQRFLELSSANGWLWNHICWHPHQTPMSRKGLGFEDKTTHNTFEAKLKIMQQMRAVHW